MTATSGKIKIPFEGKEVTARKLTVSSIIPIDIYTAWEKVKTSALLVFITKGKVKFKPAGEQFPASWKENDTVATKMLLYGLIPFGGIHTLYFEKIDNENRCMQTSERDRITKVWRHTISMQKIRDHSICYTDEVIIYAGLMTGIVTWWAKYFFIHRQQRWKLLTK
ncbi:MAG: hypothetical protein QM664_03700 [Flavihumibacter sp.]